MKKPLTIKNDLMKLERFYKSQKKRIIKEYMASVKFYSEKSKKMKANQKKTAKRVGLR